MADSYALTMAINALIALEKLGDTEGKIPLTHAIIYVCESPKSNAVIEIKFRSGSMSGYVNYLIFGKNKDNKWEVIDVQRLVSY